MTDVNTVNHAPIEVDQDSREITLPHWGITLRTLFGAALNSWDNPVPGERREYTVIHRDAPIATLFVQQHDDI